MTDPAPGSLPAQRPRSLVRFLPLLLIFAALATAFALRLHEQLSLDVLRERREDLQAFVAANLVVALLVFIALYALAVAISIPGALWLTLTGGFLFGTWLGGAATVVAATVGATAIFLAARTALGDALRGRVGPWLSRFERGFQRNAFSYILALRLFPGAPFFVVNLAPAFLGVKLRDFFFATLIGIVPGTFVYAAIGNGLRAAFEAGVAVDPVAAARDLFFSPEIIVPVAGLIVLALLPVAWRLFHREQTGAPENPAP
ncbi:MAG: TVP38/TMEM64 family protein [Hyphomonadaceae bacterium]